MPGAVVAYQAGTDDGAVGVDDPFPGGPHTAVVGLVVTDLFTGIEDAGSTADTRSGQPGRPKTCFSNITAAVAVQ
ncbi:Uncharacterised protein [Mycobacterium tuberculosis]|nr:Uncharacterised protein [Mycobacterium tuberculosis]